MMTLAAGDDSAFRRLAEISGFNARDRVFQPNSPFLTGSLDIYGPLWARALGRRDLARLREEIAGLFRITALNTLTPIGDPAALMRDLAGAGYRLGIVSNDSEASIRLQVGMLQLDPWLDFFAGWDSGYGAKPAPGMIVAYSALSGIPPERIALVGDTMHDVRAAHAAGAFAIGVLTGPAQHEDLAEHADCVIDSADCLPALLASMRQGRGKSARC